MPDLVRAKTCVGLRWMLCPLHTSTGPLTANNESALSGLIPFKARRKTQGYPQGSASRSLPARAIPG